MPIIFESTNFLEKIHHIDLLQYGEQYITSAFLFFDGKRSLIFDCGTSNDVNQIINYMELNKIPLESIEYLIPSHHHFDHNGGLWKLIKLVRKHNSNAKILATELEKSEFQNSERHMSAARSTYKDFVGTMSPPLDEEFKIIEPDTDFHFGDENYYVNLISTPGHTNDHVSPTIFTDKTPYFCFSGEASGTNMNRTKIKTLPTSMPTQFNYNVFVDSLKKLIKLKPLNIGLGHFGAITGQEDSLFLLKDHLAFLSDFRQFCKQEYEKTQKTRIVVESALEKIFKPRCDYYEKLPSIFRNNVLALVFGMLIDLGLKENKY